MKLAENLEGIRPDVDKIVDTGFLVTLNLVLWKPGQDNDRVGLFRSEAVGQRRHESRIVIIGRADDDDFSV